MNKCKIPFPRSRNDLSRNPPINSLGDKGDHGGHNADDDPDGQKRRHVQKGIQTHQHSKQQQPLQLSRDCQKIPHGAIRLADSNKWQHGIRESR